MLHNDHKQKEIYLLNRKIMNNTKIEKLKRLLTFFQDLIKYNKKDLIAKENTIAYIKKIVAEIDKED